MNYLTDDEKEIITDRTLSLKSKIDNIIPHRNSLLGESNTHIDILNTGLILFADFIKRDEVTFSDMIKELSKLEEYYTVVSKNY